jgi:beta-N-acetylhexosaminidase
MSSANALHTLESAVGQKLLLAFHGYNQLPSELSAAIQSYRPAGFTLFRAFNLKHPAQVFALTANLQRAARASRLPPFLIAVDQEGGQLSAIGEGTTPLPGNMALGAAGSTDLAYQAGQVLGRELGAMGINVNYAPCCDVNSNPANPVIGIRSFGEDPQRVAELTAAMVQGIQSCGVAAAAKHFPGHGDTSGDSHHGLPVLAHNLDRLDHVELPPFAAAIDSGVKLVMTGHLAVPAVDDRQLPATLSAPLVEDILRKRLGFSGVVVSDAMDMGAIHQGQDLGASAVMACAAGVDLLLLTTAAADHERVYTRLLAAARGQDGIPPTLDAAQLYVSARRVQALKQWLASQPAPPDLSVVGCADHRAVAAQIAARSVTLVRNQGQHLPLRNLADGRLAVVLTAPQDLTPADTSSYETHTLPQYLRECGAAVDEYLLPAAASETQAVKLVAQIENQKPAYLAVILGTINASHDPVQAALARGLLRLELPTVIVALRLPYDLTVFPEAPTYLCTYNMLAPSMRALARVLCGQTGPLGHLPVSIPGLHPIGHGLTY